MYFRRETCCNLPPPLLCMDGVSDVLLKLSSTHNTNMALQPCPDKATVTAGGGEPGLQRDLTDMSLQIVFWAA